MLRATARGTFVVKVLDTQHSSWQGTVTWPSSDETRTFRSAMEFLLIVESALQEEAEDEDAPLAREDRPRRLAGCRGRTSAAGGRKPA